MSVVQIGSLIVPWLTGKSITALTGGESDFLKRTIFWLVLILVIDIGTALIRLLSERIQQNFACDVREKVIPHLFGTVMDLPWEWHQATHSGKTTSRLQDASSALYHFAANERYFLESVVSVSGSFLMLLFMSPLIGILALLSIPVFVIMFRIFDRDLVQIRKDSMVAEQDLSVGWLDYLTNIGTVLSLRLQCYGVSAMILRLSLLRPLALRDTNLVWKKWQLTDILQQILSIIFVVVFVLINSNKNPALLGGMTVAMMAYLSKILNATNFFAAGQQSMMDYRMRLDIADEFERDYAQYRHRNRPMQNRKWTNAVLSGLTFRHEDQTHRAHHLEGVGVTLERGQRIALVGSSGSGKSTLLRLIRGLHEPASGSLTIDGTETEFAALSALSTLVLQDAEIFENTLRYNIAFGMTADDDALNRAVEIACLGPVLDGLEKGLDTDIRERGVNLSGGQKQRLSLARGLYAGRDSSLLLLDEPTSSLDTVTEAEIIGRLFADRPDACIVASLHRLHLLDRFDYVYVMDSGRIVEEGSFTDLLAAEGKLFDLWQAQTREDRESGRADGNGRKD